jgi:hypothetical protein
MDVATTVTVVAALTLAGALYVAAVVVVGVSVPDPVAGVSAQVTPALAVSSRTRAVMLIVCPCPIVCGLLGVNCTALESEGAPEQPEFRRQPTVRRQDINARLARLMMTLLGRRCFEPCWNHPPHFDGKSVCLASKWSVLRAYEATGEGEAK